MDSVQSLIKEEIQAKEGKILFPVDFLRYGSLEAVHMALSRLTTEKEIKRLAKGIYLRPKKHAKMGEIMPSLEDIARAIAEKENVVIKPTGAYALNKLGLSTQVPMQVVFLTNGQPRSIKIGKSRITFKRTTPKKLGADNETVFLVTQALQALDGNVPENDPAYDKLLDALRRVPPSIIRAEARYAPQNITRILHQMANKIAHNG